MLRKDSFIASRAGNRSFVTLFALAGLPRSPPVIEDQKQWYFQRILLPMEGRTGNSPIFFENTAHIMTGQHTN